MQQQQSPIANAAEVKRDLEYMTARWHELNCSLWIEVRAFKEGCQTQIAKFRPDWIDEAVDWIVSVNSKGYNLYAVRNPIRGDLGSGSASDTDIVASFFLWADCDDPASAGNVHRFDGPKWSAAVVTGQTPSTRVHTYWQLREPCMDMAAWRDMQTAIAMHFGSDRSVINPSRIMRIGGTVAWPSTKKRERGYIDELTTIRTTYDDARDPVTLDQMARIFGSSAPAIPLSQQASPKIDLGPQYAPALDRERMAIQAMSGIELAQCRHSPCCVLRRAWPVRCRNPRPDRSSDPFRLHRRRHAARGAGGN